MDETPRDALQSLKLIDEHIVKLFDSHLRRLEKHLEEKIRRDEHIPDTGGMGLLTEAINDAKNVADVLNALADVRNNYKEISDDLAKKRDTAAISK
mgnify:CR=1 FL=1